MSTRMKDMDWSELLERLTAVTSDHPVTPNKDETQRILDERARLLARPLTDVTRDAPALTMIMFACHGERYAIETSYVRETVRSTGLTRVPGVPDWFVGIESVRGEMVAVVELGRFFGAPAFASSDAPSWLLVLGREDAEVAIRCNEILDVVLLPRDRIWAPPHAATADGRRDILGVTDDAVVVLDANELLQDSRLFVEQNEYVEV